MTKQITTRFWAATLIMSMVSFMLACFAFSTPVKALQTVPYKMNFQGRVTDASGNALANGTYNMKFRIYDALTAGTLQWSEQRANSASTGVTVTNGLFSVQLGDVTSLPISIFTNQNLYFEIELPTPATATCSTASCEAYTEGPMGPRNKLGTSAYAFNSDTLDGLDSSAFGQFSTSNTWTNTNTFSGAVTVAQTSTAAFQVQSASGADTLFRADSTNNRIVIGNATGTDTATTLLVLDSATADPTTGVANGAMYYNSTTNKFRCRQGGAFVDCIGAGASAGTQYVTLVPEYAGAVLSADGTSNVMDVTSKAVSGLAVGEGYKHNFYQFSTSAATAQNYDIVINYQLPSNFSSFVTGSFKLWTKVDSLTSTDVTVMVKSATGASCYVSAVSVKPTTAAVWQQKAPGDPGNGCTFAANDIVTFDIKPYAIQPNTNMVRIGEFQFAYQ